MVVHRGNVVSSPLVPLPLMSLPPSPRSSRACLSGVIGRVESRERLFEPDRLVHVQMEEIRSVRVRRNIIRMIRHHPRGSLAESLQQDVLT